MTNEVTGRGSSLVDLWWVAGLSGLAIMLLLGWDKLQEIRKAPILLAAKPTGRHITIAIPEFVVPRTEGESSDSVSDKYKPKITIDGMEWVISVPQVDIAREGLSFSFLPPPIRVPIVPKMSIVALALKLTPKVFPVSEPPGWRVRFPVITLEV